MSPSAARSRSAARLVAPALLLLGGAAAACSSEPRSDAAGDGGATAAARAGADTAPPTASGGDGRRSFVPPGAVIFDPPALRRGDRVATLVVDTLRVDRTGDGAEWVGMVRFAGEIELTGTTIPHIDPEARAVCFEADSATAARLPRWPNDERRSWFCLTNEAEASRTLAPPGRMLPATIVIDDFTTVRSFTDAVNEARLVRVVRKGE